MRNDRDALTEQHELVWWLPIILVALLAINAMFRSSRRPREPAPPRRLDRDRVHDVASGLPLDPDRGDVFPVRFDVDGWLRSAAAPDLLRPSRFSLGRMLLAALFLAGLVFLVKWGR